MNKRFQFVHRCRSQFAVVAGFSSLVSLVSTTAYAQLTYLNSWGSGGSGDGQFNGIGIGGLAVGPGGTVYVTDNGNYRVEYFNATGTFLGSFGSYPEFQDPEGAAVDSTGKIYVVDYINSCVEVFSSTGEFQGDIGQAGYGDGQFNSPYDAAIGADGTICVTDSNNNRIQYFSSGGALGGTFGSQGSGNGQFDHPLWVAAAPNGTVYVSDQNNRVQYFNSNGVFQGVFEQVSGALAVGSTGIVYVAAGGNSVVDAFTSTGVFQYGSGGDYQAATPYAIAVAPTGMVYVGNFDNDSVARLFDPNSWTSGTNYFTNPNVGPTNVAVGPNQILGTSVTLTSSMGLIVGTSTTITSGGTLILGGGTLTTNTLNVNSGGTFQYGNSGSIGALTGAILNNGRIAVSLSGAAATLANDISGTGCVTVSGGGTLIVTGANSYSGKTIVDAVSSLVVGAAGGLSPTGTIINNGSLMIEAGNAIAPVVAGSITGSGDLTIGNQTMPAFLRLASGSGTSSQASLTINEGSTLDLTNAALIVNYVTGSDPIYAIQSYLQTGYANGGWNGVGIDSSAVANLNASQSALVYSLGYADGADGIVNGLSLGEIEIMPTLAGDAKLQGDVVFGDFQLLAANFGLAGGWDRGNFTYGSVVNFGDFQLLAQNFGATSTSLSTGNSAAMTASELSSLNSFAAQFGDRLLANPDGVGYQIVSVPEPAAGGILAMAGIGLRRRRRR